jgi:predicted AAA+ superfamily ATPase
MKILKRKIYEKLAEWKKNKNHKPILIKGARQIGKTKIVEIFSENYKSFLKLDFREDMEIKEIFEGKISSDSIINRIKLKFPNFNFIKNETLIFFDEIQLCNNALSSLKYLQENKEIDIVCSGSLLTLSISEKDFYPVGALEHLIMYPLDFEEFLWAKGIDEKQIDELKQKFFSMKRVDEFTNKYFMAYFLEFICVGGMPECVIDFIENNDFLSLNKIQKRLIYDYRNDISKTKTKDEEKKNVILKALECFDSIPAQLSKDNKKFKFSLVNKNARSYRYSIGLK